ncbi:ABC transporter permease [Schaalia sp. ZJ1691]|uniref:ABC transporter permease n=1 Tax=Schaalia sp. ZJ1691 TaxID=2709404 RepID=UPI0013EA172E|nr:ABC transporter permease [Schaalia sp. ZJ1691]
MLRMIIQDLRISPGRAFLTGFSMLIGIIAVIVSVLAGTIGKDYLAATNEQLYGRAPTYSMLMSSQHFSESASLSSLIGALEKNNLHAALSLTPDEDHTYIVTRDLDHPPNTDDLASGLSVDTVYTTAGYASVYNLPMAEGRWLTQANQMPRLELVANKPAAQNFPLHSYAYLTTGSTLTPTPLEVTGIVNDGLNFPRIYVNVEGLAALAPHLWTSTNATFYWHDQESRTDQQRSTLIADLLHDYAPGTTNRISRSDTQEYEGVLQIISLSFIVTSVLLLGVAAIGLINIGLASIEQRTHELLIRRALGATRGSVAGLVIGSSLLLAVIVAGVAIVISMALVESIPLFLPRDTPITAPGYPYLAALAAVTAAVVTALIGSIAPAIRATRLQPALALR